MSLLLACWQMRKKSVSDRRACHRTAWCEVSHRPCNQTFAQWAFEQWTYCQFLIGWSTSPPTDWHRSKEGIGDKSEWMMKRLSPKRLKDIRRGGVSSLFSWSGCSRSRMFFIPMSLACFTENPPFIYRYWTFIPSTTSPISALITEGTFVHAIPTANTALPLIL